MYDNTKRINRRNLGDDLNLGPPDAKNWPQFYTISQQGNSIGGLSYLSKNWFPVGWNVVLILDETGESRAQPLVEIMQRHYVSTWSAFYTLRNCQFWNWTLETQLSTSNGIIVCVRVFVCDNSFCRWLVFCYDLCCLELNKQSNRQTDTRTESTMTTRSVA